MGENMPNELIITNGDTAAESIRALKSAAGAVILPWRDVLHEGPIPSVDQLEMLSEKRAQHLAERGFGDFEEVYGGFVERDAVLRSHGDFKLVTLWFEHDLYDQLQLIQLLDFFAQDPREPGTLHLIQSARFLAEEPPHRLEAQRKLSRPVTDSDLRQAVKAWQALRQPNPISWARVSEGEINGLPFLRPAAARHLEELPASHNGLTRTERSALHLIESGHVTPVAVFRGLLAEEEAKFMGDLSVFATLDELAHGNSPLITGLEGGPFRYDLGEAERKIYLASEMQLTEFGRAVLHGHADALETRQIDRWFGGTRLMNGHVWRWDEETRWVVAP